MTRARRPTFDPARRSSTTKIGALIGSRYAVEGRLGIGAMARVYRARDVQTGAPVAVKILEPDHFHRPGGTEQFLREAEIARQVDHPSIVRVHSVGERGDKRPYIVMELLEGETLGEYLAREGTMPLQRTLFVLTEIAGGLLAAHEAGVVHRDVKPDNIFLVGPQGAPMAAKLLDFGLAETTRGVRESTQGVAAGTMQYMAPEQVLADPVSGQTDVYALGVVLFRALTGALPFEGDEDVIVLAHQVWSRPPPPSWLDEELPPGLDAVIAGTLRKHPENRYASMADLREELCALAEDPYAAVQPPRILRIPDVYEPQTSLAEEGARFLSSKLSR